MAVTFQNAPRPYAGKFSQVKPGECFIYNSMLMMRLAEGSRRGDGAVCLTDGVIWDMDDEELADPVDVTVTVAGAPT